MAGILSVKNSNNWLGSWFGGTERKKMKSKRKRKKRSSSPSSNESSPSQRRKQEDDQGTVAADDEFDFPNIEAHKLDTSVARGKAELSKRRSTKPRRRPTRQRSTSTGNEDNDFGFSIAPETKENRQPAIANELNGSVDSLDREDVFNQNTVAAAAVSSTRHAASAAERPPSPDWVTVSFNQAQEPQMSPTKPIGVALTGLASGGSSRSSSNKVSPASPEHLEHLAHSPASGSPQAKSSGSPSKTGVLIPGLEELESSPVKLRTTPTREKLPSPPEEAAVPSWAKDTQLKKVRTPEEKPTPEEPTEKEGPWTKQAQLKKVESPPSKEDDEEMAKENEPPEQDWRARLKKSFKSGKDTKREKSQEKAAPDWAKKAEEKNQKSCDKGGI